MMSVQRSSSTSSSSSPWYLWSMTSERPEMFREFHNIFRFLGKCIFTFLRQQNSAEEMDAKPESCHAGHKIDIPSIFAGPQSHRRFPDNFHPPKSAGILRHAYPTQEVDKTRCVRHFGLPLRYLCTGAFAVSVGPSCSLSPSSLASPSAATVAAAPAMSGGSQTMT